MNTQLPDLIKNGHGSDRFARAPRVRELFGGVAGNTLSRWVKQGLLVRPLKLGPRTRLWPTSEIVAIVAARASGASEAEVRLLVNRLHETRLIQLTEA